MAFNYQKINTYFILSVKLIWSALIFLGLFVSGFMLLDSLAKGFDITDESYYLLSVMQPQNQLFETSHFGYALAPLYFLSGGNVISFKLLGILFLFFAGLLFTVLLKKYWQSWSHTVYQNSVILPSITALMYYHHWLLVPSYNWLAFVSTLLFGSGIFLFCQHNEALEKKQHLIFVVSSILVGFGGTLAFLAKPTTAFLLASIFLLWVCYHRHNKNILAFFITSGCIALAVLFIHSIISFSGPSGYLNDLRGSFESGELLGASHSFSEVNKSLWTSLSQMASLFIKFYVTRLLLLGYVVLLILKYTSNLLNQERYSLKPRAIHFFTSLVLFSWFLAILQANQIRIPHVLQIEGQLTPGSILVMMLWVFILASFLIHQLTENQNKKDFEHYKTILFLSFVLFLMSIAYVYGTNNLPMVHITGGSFFLILGIFYVSNWMFQQTNYIFYNKILSLLITLQLVLCMWHGYTHPYRLQGTILDQKIPITFLNGKVTLYTDNRTASYVKKLMSDAIANGWQKNIPLIDMTGGSPGALVILSARILGKGWFSGGYSGSSAYALDALKHMPSPLLQKAWVLTAPNGIISLDTSILKACNLDFPSHYTLVGEYMTAHRDEKQYLWKPL